METLKQEVEKTIRRYYGFGSNINVNDVDVQFSIATGTNGVMPMVQTNTEKRPYKKRTQPVAKASKALHREYTTSPEDIAAIRHFFAKWERGGKLTHEQRQFIDSTKGIRYPSLDENMKSGMLNLFEKIREVKLFNKQKEDATVE